MKKSGKLKILFCVVAAVMAITACGKKNEEPPTSTVQEQVKEPALSDIHEAVKAVYGENYIPSENLDATAIQSVYGISEDMYEEAIAEVPLMSVHVDTFLAFKAKEGQADAIEEKLTEYRDYLINDSMQYPMNVPKINASQIVREGNYVFFIQLGMVENDMADEDELLKQFQESNQLAVDAVKKQFE